MNMDISQRGHVVLCLALIFIMSLADCNEVIKYCSNCTGENVIGSPHVACKSANQNSLPDCPDTSVVVATICLGQLPSDGADCTHTSGNCLSTYDPYSAALRALRLRDKIQKCLWKKSKCGIKMEDVKYKWDHKDIACSRRNEFDYLAVFNFVCVPKCDVFYMCDGTHAGYLPNVGYILSPYFPMKNDKILGTCEKTFNFTQPRTFNFIIQYLDLNNHQNMDWVRIDTIELDGRVRHGDLYTGVGVNYYHNYTTIGLGFVITFQRKGQDQLIGFLMSYSVSAYVPPVTDAPTTTFPTHPETVEIRVTSSGVTTSVSLVFMLMCCLLSSFS